MLNQSMIMRMPTIEERESEHDNKEELERKEKEYKKKIARLEQEMSDLRGKREDMH